MSEALTSIELPPSAKTAEDKLRCGVRLQWMMVEGDRRRVEDAGAAANMSGTRDFQRRVVQVSPSLVALRRKVFPGRLKDGEENDPYQVLKAEAREYKAWDADLKDHPLLIAKQPPNIEIDPFQDFSGYDIEPDPLVYTTITATLLEVAALPSNVDEYVHKDFGASYFAGTFSHIYETQCTAKAANSRGGLCFTANEVDDWYNNTDAAGFYWFSNSSNVLYAYIGHRIGGAFGDYDSWASPALSTWYYITYFRHGSGDPTATCTIRTGSHAGAVSDVLAMGEDATARRYFQGMSSRNDGSAAVMSYDVRNVDLMGLVKFRRRIEGY